MNNCDIIVVVVLPPVVIFIFLTRVEEGRIPQVQEEDRCLTQKTGPTLRQRNHCATANHVISSSKQEAARCDMGLQNGRWKAAGNEGISASKLSR